MTQGITRVVCTAVVIGDPKPTSLWLTLNLRPGTCKQTDFWRRMCPQPWTVPAALLSIPGIRCPQSGAEFPQQIRLWNQVPSISAEIPVSLDVKTGWPLNARSDVLSFVSRPLKQNLEITGPVTVKLYVSSSAPDTDFTAKLLEVIPPCLDYPEGLAINLTDSILRARYRNSWTAPELMQKGQIYQLEFSLYPTSNLFKAGHHIRIDISSSNFPRFDVSPNTGGNLGTDRRFSLADPSRFPRR